MELHGIPYPKIKRRKKLQSRVKNMHYCINTDELKPAIEKLGHTVTNVWNAKQFRAKLPLSMFFVELKPAPNNKEISSVEHLQQCKITFEPPRHKGDIAQCAKCQS
jgi:hypothetical protein